MLASARPPSRWACRRGNLLRRLKGEPTRPFRYIDYGNLATVVRRPRSSTCRCPASARSASAVCRRGLFWLFAHISFLIASQRLIVMVLAWAYFTYERAPGVVEPQPTPSYPAPRIGAMDTRTPRPPEHRAIREVLQKNAAPRR